MNATSKCQITLPCRLREAVGIGPRQEVETFLIEHDGRPVIAIAPISDRSRGRELASRWVGCLKERGTTDQLLCELRGHE